MNYWFTVCKKRYVYLGLFKQYILFLVVRKTLTLYLNFFVYLFPVLSHCTQIIAFKTDSMHAKKSAYFNPALKMRFHLWVFSACMYWNALLLLLLFLFYFIFFF